MGFDVTVCYSRRGGSIHLGPSTFGLRSATTARRVGNLSPQLTLCPTLSVIRVASLSPSRLPVSLPAVISSSRHGRSLWQTRCHPRRSHCHSRWWAWPPSLRPSRWRAFGQRQQQQISDEACPSVFGASPSCLGTRTIVFIPELHGGRSKDKGKPAIGSSGKGRQARASRWRFGQRPVHCGEALTVQVDGVAGERRWDLALPSWHLHSLGTPLCQVRQL